MSQENVDFVRRMYEGIQAVQPNLPEDDLLALGFHADVEVQQLRGLAGTAGVFRGYEGLRQMGRELLEALEDVQFEPLEHVASGNRVAFIVRATGTGRGSGVPVEIQVGHLFEFRGERIARWIVYANPDEALDAVGLRE